MKTEHTSVIEWHEFNVDDESTWPDTEYEEQFITNNGCLAFEEGQWLTLDTDAYHTNRPAHGVTHWAYLPEFKGGQNK